MKLRAVALSTLFIGYVIALPALADQASRQRYAVRGGTPTIAQAQSDYKTFQAALSHMPGVAAQCSLETLQAQCWAVPASADYGSRLVYIAPFPLNVDLDPTRYDLVWADSGDVRNGSQVYKTWKELAASGAPFGCNKTAVATYCERIVIAQPSEGVSLALADCQVVVVNRRQGAPTHCVAVSLDAGNGSIYLHVPYLLHPALGIGFQESTFEIDGKDISVPKLLQLTQHFLSTKPYDLTTQISSTAIVGVVSDHLSQILPSPWHESVSLEIIVSPKDDLHRFLRLQALNQMSVSLRNTASVEDWNPADDIQLSQYSDSVKAQLKRVIRSICSGTWTDARTFICKEAKP